MIYHLMFISMFEFAGKNSWDRSKLILEDSGAASMVEFDYEIALALYPVCRTIMIVSVLLRLLLLCASFKWPKVCKMFLAFEITTILLD